MTRKVFLKLLGLFALLLVFNLAVMEVAFRQMLPDASSPAFQQLTQDALWSGVIALAIALPLAGWVAFRITGRLQQVVDFAHRIATGDLTARLHTQGDELSSMEVALNQTAEQLGQSFAAIESGRQELATMLDSMQEAVVAVSAEGQVRWSNAVMQRMAGTEIRVGRSLVQSVRDPDLLSCVKGALETGTVHTGRSSSMAPGRILEINAAPLPSGGAIAVLHDVTRIEAAERSRRDFIANVSHELRTPLTSVQGYVETLIESPEMKPDTAREFLNVIQKNTRRMSRLTEDLLALAGVESPDYKLVKQPIRASALVHDAIESLGGLVVDSGVEIENAGAPDSTILADPDAMNQVFGNLIENALKYGSRTDNPDKKIRVGAHHNGPDVEFFVQDFGPGIASEHLGRIFERFYRVDKARSRETGGTGLGLSIVAQIVHAHGGHVRAESELGSGSTFFFTLPVTG